MKKGIGYLYDKKKNNEKMPRTALYDYPMACIAEEAGIDIINVGDSIAMVMFGSSCHPSATRAYSAAMSSSNPS